MLLKVFRTSMGSLIVFLSWITSPRPQKRSFADQKKVQEFVSGFSLYQHNGCPFCVKTRRAIRRLNLDIEIRDVGKNEAFRKELETEGGRIKVPCLRVDEAENSSWIYESSEIISFLEKRVSMALI